jgi:hypothetical protein
VGGDPQVLERAGDPAGAEQVDLHGAVEWRIERHGGGRVDDDVARRQGRSVGVVEAQAVGADVAGDDLDPAVDERIEL